MAEVTQLLEAAARGDRSAAAELLPHVYEELRRLAAVRMNAEKPGHTLDATALVHEAFLRLAGPQDGRKWDGRAHFFAAAAEAMRRILVESARRKRSEKHGGGLVRHDADVMPVARAEISDDIVALNEALERFSAHDPQKAELVKLRYFIGLTIEESADILGISAATTKRYWTYAKAWLYHALSADGETFGNSAAS